MIQGCDRRSWTYLPSTGEFGLKPPKRMRSTNPPGALTDVRLLRTAPRYAAFSPKRSAHAPGIRAQNVPRPFSLSRTPPD